MQGCFLVNWFLTAYQIGSYGQNENSMKSFIENGILKCTFKKLIIKAFNGFPE